MGSVKKNKYLLTIFVALFLCLTVRPVFAGKYYSLEEFIQENPNEEVKLKSFNRLVKRNIVAKIKNNLKVKISIVYPGNQISDYWRRSYKAFDKRIKQYGIKTEINSFFMSPTDPLHIQRKILKQALKTNPDYLIFTLDALRHQRMIEPLLIRNKPRVILQNITTPLKAWNDKQPLMYIGFDHETGSIKLAQQYANKTGGKGKYAVLLPSPGYLSEERGKSFTTWLDANTELELVTVYQTGINKQKSRRATLKIVKEHPDISFIYACSTDIALGAVEALKEKSLLGKIMVNGWGGGSPELQAIKNGELDFTIMRINDDNGIAMADAIILDLLGQTKRLPLIYSGRLMLIGKDIDPINLEQLQRESFRYSGFSGKD
ncbi:substrate-binding domain-containing protein [Maridesulfovibrio zosterae]|uniref:substrate-binding domain-containing protein n=1 Tax=Maridesulfovibrio zosterae TaxID=82171 RepID=UPI0003F727B9|nr:substrate-binding domain-containing protein [Maridesulfovibrio zosterae]